MRYNLIGREQLDAALTMLAELLMFNNSEPIHLIACGGSALIALDLVQRTTKDLDVIALYKGETMHAPVPLPDMLCRAANDVQLALNFPENWLNNGPSSNSGGLFQMGLPDGLELRTLTKAYGQCLSVSFIGRQDQIFFKLWASVDRGGYHIDDLLKLKPTEDEIVAASRWTLQKDVSDGYRMVLIQFLEHIGFSHVINRIT